MKSAIHSYRSEGICWLVGAVLAALPAAAQPAIAPTSHSHLSMTPVPFEEARRTAEGLRSKVAARAAATNAPAAPEIVELARALKNDPDLIYQYVHDNIEYSPLWGLLKGPVGTLLDGRGDAFDQCSLMVALLNQAALTNTAVSGVTYEFGELNLTSAQLQSWLGVDGNPNSIGGILGSGGIPGSTFNNGNAQVGHVWVKVSINGTPYVFDPAFKAHNWKTGIVANLPTIMGYTQAQFVADAGAAVTANSITNVNRTALRNDLTTYTNKLATYVRTNLPTGGVSDLVGGGTIVPAALANGVTVRQTTNPNQLNAPTDWTAIPSSYFATLTVSVQGGASHTFNSADIYGHRLSIFFDTSYTPTLYLDGAALTHGVPDFEGDSVAVDESIDLPWANFADQALTQYVTAESNAHGAGYVIQTGWDQVGRAMIEKHRTILTQAISSGAALNSELVLGETASVLGLTWLAQCADQQHLADRLLGTVTQYYYGGGIAGIAVGTTIVSPYVDLPLNFINTPARISVGSQQSPASMAAFLDSSGVSSSFESTTLEQTQAAITGFTAASTVKLLDIGIQNNDTIFDINNGNTAATQQNYSNVIRPQLAAHYNPGDLSTVDSYVSSGFRVIAPLHGELAVGKWTGVGFKTMQGTQDSGFSYGEIISGGLSGVSHRQAGGFGGTGDPNSPGYTGNSMQPGSNSPGSNGPGGNGNVGDPMDRRKGSLQFHNTDLLVGSKAFPYGLGVERNYDSGAQASTGPLGNGWTHNFAMAAAAGSDGFTGMGEGSLLNAVSAIASLFVSSDLVNGQALSGQANLANFVLEAVVNHWFTDQLTQNVVYVSQGWNTEEFVKMADGTYSAPVGSATLLDAPGGNFRYRTKAGVAMNFNSSGQVSSWANAAGTAIGFTYSGGHLSTVANAVTGRQLTMTYSGNLISSISDGSRTISYGYTGNNLTSFTDALTQKTTYVYDTSGTQDTAGHLTQVFYPSHPTNAFLTTFYDTLGRVSQQNDGIGNSTFTFFAGSRTEIDDPAGNRHVWYNDSLGNQLSEIQDYGPSPHLNLTTSNTYDGQSNLLTVTMPEGNSVTHTYDALFNPLTVTRTPKPGSSLGPLAQTYTYTVPVTSLPNFEEVLTAKDANGNVTNYGYNSTTGTVSTITKPTVIKAGVGPQAPQQQFTYTASGLLQTTQDAEGRVTRWDYDATLGDQLVKMTVDFGGLNLITQYTYDSYGDTASLTDPNGHTTTTVYDKLRRLTEVDGPIAGVVTKYTYYPDGQIKTRARQTTAGAFETTQYTYTTSNKVSVVTDPLGNAVTTTYDAADRIMTVTTQVSPTQSRIKTFAYDALNREYQVYDTTAASPGVLLQTYTFTPNGGRLTFQDANSHTTTFTYDGLDRLSQTTYPDNSSEKFSYDSNGNLLQRQTRGGQTIAFTYDALNRMLTKTPAGEAAGQVSYGYDLTSRMVQALDASSVSPYQIVYDTAGRAVSFTDQQGRNVQVQYDSAGNRTRIQWPANTNGASAYFVTYKFDAMNRMTEIDPNGSSATPLAKYQWDALSRETQVLFGDSTSDTYSQYDNGDNLLSMTESFTGGSNVTFGYSWQGSHQRQATTVNNSLFQYSPTTGTTNYAAANVANGYTSVGAATLTYDGNRNLTYDGYNTLTYDVENRVVQAQNALGTSQYLYDPLGHRKQKSVNGVTTQFVSLGDTILADYSGPGVGTPQLLTVPGVGGLPVATVTVSTGAVTYYHHDIIGSTVGLTAAGTAGPAEAHSYSEFGLPSGGSSALYLYAGYRYDQETGLYYVNARYYSPVLGRFLQNDPIGYAGGRNLYAYGHNDPINVRDPLGTCGDASGCGWGSSILNFISDHPFLSAGIAVAAVAAVVLAPEILLAGGALEEGVLAEEGLGLAARGVSQFGGEFSSIINAAGGELWTAVGSIEQADFAGIVTTAVEGGSDVTILTGVHGGVGGEIVAELAFYAEDMEAFGALPGVNVLNILEMSASEITTILNGPGTIIGAFCSSGVCLAPFM